MGDMKNSYKIFIGNPEGDIPLGRPRRRCENNSRIDLGEIMWESED
jgi:hypothetical protein